jgi:hypothetical protein
VGVTDTRVLPLGSSKYSRHQFDTAGGRPGVGRWGVWEDEEYGGMRRVGRALAAVAGALMVLGVVACGGDDDDSGEASAVEDLDTTTEAGDDAGSTTSTTLSPEDQVIADYTAASAAFSAAANPPNPDSPDLEAHFTGASLSRYQDALRSLQAAGATAQNTVEHHPIDVTVTGETAQLEDCFVDTTQQFNAATGEALGGPSTTTLHVEVTLQLIDGVWKVAERSERSDPCTPS